MGVLLVTIEKTYDDEGDHDDEDDHEHESEWDITLNGYQGLPSATLFWPLWATD
jgi:hypothetical protein